MSEEFIKKVISSLKCDYCGKNYNPDNIHIMERQGNHWLLKVHCPTCSVGKVITVILKNEGKNKVSPYLTQNQIGDSKLQSPVTMDDVLDIHNLLQETSGNFADLLSD